MQGLVLYCRRTMAATNFSFLMYEPLCARDAGGYKNNHWCPVKSQRFFASLRMTAIYKYLEEGRLGLRRSRKPNLPSSRNSLIVISNEVRNLSIKCIEMIS